MSLSHGLEYFYTKWLQIQERKIPWSDHLVKEVENPLLQLELLNSNWPRVDSLRPCNPVIPKFFERMKSNRYSMCADRRTKVDILTMLTIKRVLKKLRIFFLCVCKKGNLASFFCKNKRDVKSWTCIFSQKKKKKNERKRSWSETENRSETIEIFAWNKSKNS
jgi:hypothetical protein